jgi:hypothetical protein
MRNIVCACVLAAVMVAAGCSGNRRVPVEGTVTYDGTPIPIGTITFIPTFEKGEGGGGRIENGRFKLDAAASLMPGPYKVEIRWAKPTGKKYKNEFGEEFDRTQEGLPDKYHSQTTLTAYIEPGMQPLDFNLEK